MAIDAKEEPGESRPPDGPGSSDDRGLADGGRDVLWPSRFRAIPIEYFTAESSARTWLAD